MEGHLAGSVVPLAARSSNTRTSGRSRCLLTPHRNPSVAMAARQTALLGRRLISAAPQKNFIGAAATRAQHTERSAARNNDMTRTPEEQSPLTGGRDPSLEILSKAITFEAARGYSDVQGQSSRFSSFAAQALRGFVGTAAGPSTAAGGLGQGLLERMEAYPAMSREDRQALLSEVQGRILPGAGASSAPPRPSAAAAAAPVAAGVAATPRPGSSRSSGSSNMEETPEADGFMKPLTPPDGGGNGHGGGERGSQTCFETGRTVTPSTPTGGAAAGVCGGRGTPPSPMTPPAGISVGSSVGSGARRQGTRDRFASWLQGSHPAAPASASAAAGGRTQQEQVGKFQEQHQQPFSAPQWSPPSMTAQEAARMEAGAIAPPQTTANHGRTQAPGPHIQAPPPLPPPPRPSAPQAQVPYDPLPKGQLHEPQLVVAPGEPKQKEQGTVRQQQEPEKADEATKSWDFEQEALLWYEQQQRLQQQQGEHIQGQQRSEEWHRLRFSRLTASSFGNALGFWRGGREELWEEKLGLKPAFSGNDATAWGTEREDQALEAYEAATGRSVSQECMFKTLQDDPVHDWLGASPDGLILPGASAAAFGSSDIALLPGILEVKCPFNKGRPQEATPYRSMPFYYMPQVQGLMEVFDREWCDVYSWTVNGSAIYMVRRNRKYWAEMDGMLGEFWWENVVPAKHAISRGDLESAEIFRPEDTHERTSRIIAWSKELSRECLYTAIPPGPAESRASN